MNGKDEFGLLPKQRNFADHYLSGMYAGQALRAAGYRATKPEKGAYKMLQRPQIRHYIHTQRQQLAAKATADRQEVIHWLHRVIMTPIGRAADDHRDLLESEYHHTYKNGRTTRRLRMVSKMSAIRLLCQLMGWTGPEQNQEQSDLSELAEMVRRARSRQGRDRPPGGPAHEKPTKSAPAP